MQDNQQQPAIPFENIGEEGVKRLRLSLKFGDVVVNHYASATNPHRTGIFIMFEERSLLISDMKGSFWKTVFDSKAKLEVIGNFLSDQQQTIDLIRQAEAEAREDVKRLRAEADRWRGKCEEAEKEAEEYRTFIDEIVKGGRFAFVSDISCAAVDVIKKYPQPSKPTDNG